jgi:hypothetical protein
MRVSSINTDEGVGEEEEVSEGETGGDDDDDKAAVSTAAAAAVGEDGEDSDKGSGNKGFVVGVGCEVNLGEAEETEDGSKWAWAME